MKTKMLTAPALIVSVTLGVCLTLSAQQPQPPAKSETEAVTPLETTLYLKQDYVDSMKASGIFADNKFVGVRYGYDGNFVTMQRKDTHKYVFIPTSVVLCMVDDFSEPTK